MHVVKKTGSAPSGGYDNIILPGGFVQQHPFEISKQGFIIFGKKIKDTYPESFFKQIISIGKCIVQLISKVPAKVGFSGSHITDQIDAHSGKSKNNFSTFAPPKKDEIMNIRSLAFYISVITFLLVYGCRSDGHNGNIPADLVNNPNSASEKSDKASLPAIKFEETEHDFGRIIEGETVSFAFNFTNTGKSDLIIAEVTSSCGCTVPSYPKMPIRPGESGTVKVAFNSNGKRGYQSKDVVVASNTQPNTTVIRIKAQVVNPGAEK